jgi:hypothetical protein
MASTVKIDGEVIYQVKRWRVLRIVPQVQSTDHSVPHVPDQLRLWRLSTGEAIWAPADEVVPA